METMASFNFVTVLWSVAKKKADPELRLGTHHQRRERSSHHSSFNHHENQQLNPPKTRQSDFSHRRTTAILSKMAVLSALVLIRILSVFHITIAFYLLTAPHLLADQNLVFILGESVHLVRQSHTKITLTLANVSSTARGPRLREAHPGNSLPGADLRPARAVRLHGRINGRVAGAQPLGLADAGAAAVLLRRRGLRVPVQGGRDAGPAGGRPWIPGWPRRSAQERPRVLVGLLGGCAVVLGLHECQGGEEGCGREDNGGEGTHEGVRAAELGYRRALLHGGGVWEFSMRVHALFRI